jgi:hypothetical protein
MQEVFNSGSTELSLNNGFFMVMPLSQNYDHSVCRNIWIQAEHCYLQKGA